MSVTQAIISTPFVRIFISMFPPLCVLFCFLLNLTNNVFPARSRHQPTTEDKCSRQLRSAGRAVEGQGSSYTCSRDPPGARRQDTWRYLVHCSGAAGAPEQWKWTLSHLASRRCHTRVSSDWQERGRLWLSMYCVRRMYAMQAASSPIRCTWGLRMVVCTGLLFLLSTVGEHRRSSSCQRTSPHLCVHVTAEADAQIKTPAGRFDLNDKVTDADNGFV